MAFSESLAQFLVTEQLGEMGKYLQVFIGEMIGYKQGKQQVDRLVINRIEIDSGIQFNKRGNDSLASRQARMWNRNTIAEPSAAETLAAYKAVEYTLGAEVG